MPVLAKFGHFWAQNPIFWAQGVKILVPSYRDSNETPFSCWKHWSVRLQLAARGENVLFWPKNLDIWGKKVIFFMAIAIFVNRAYHKYTWGYNFPIRTTPKKSGLCLSEPVPLPPLGTIRTLFVNLRQKSRIFTAKNTLSGKFRAPGPPPPPYLGQGPKKFHFLEASLNVIFHSTTV